ncbi:Hypothetical predicted protein [Olea europaea subsp. europaea]|uniref:Uncharacterized protein n=1 Tax=Olea europaea subsp. europaea TaxID=158383 RepID=A0A8S0RC55_OLEEU|nr:Hypothetical predicted protein [Olea europaea subsp. europaea]
MNAQSSCDRRPGIARTCLELSPPGTSSRRCQAAGHVPEKPHRALRRSAIADTSLIRQKPFKLVVPAVPVAVDGLRGRSVLYAGRPASRGSLPLRRGWSGPAPGAGT